MPHDVEERERPRADRAGQQHESHLGRRRVHEASFDVGSGRHRGARDDDREPAGDSHDDRGSPGAEWCEPQQQKRPGVHESGVQDRRHRCRGGKRRGQPSVKGNGCRARDRRDRDEDSDEKRQSGVDGRQVAQGGDRRPRHDGDRRQESDIADAEGDERAAQSHAGLSSATAEGDERDHCSACDHPSDRQDDRIRGCRRNGESGSQNRRQGEEPGRARVSLEVADAPQLHSPGHAEGERGEDASDDIARVYGGQNERRRGQGEGDPGGRDADRPHPS